MSYNDSQRVFNGEVHRHRLKSATGGMNFVYDRQCGVALMEDDRRAFLFLSQSVQNLK